MTRNEVSIIKNAVLDATEAYVDARLKVADFVKTQIGVVTASEQRANKKWYHTVSCNATQSNPYGIVYTEVLSINNIHFVDGSVVFILAPNAQFSNQFILGKLDNVPYDLSISGIDIGNGTFVVDSNGKCTIKNGEINLTLKHDSRISTDTYNIILDANGEKIGAHVVDRGSGQNPRYVWEHYFNVDNNGNVNITKGSITLGGNFSVTSAGKVTIKSGSITLGSVFKVDETGWLAIGGTTSSANFYVATDGSVTIKKGSMTIGSGFKIDTDGNLSIGGTTSSANFYVNHSDGSVTIKKGSININNGKFYVDTNGNLTAKYITANEGGQIGGATIYNNRLEYSSGDALFSRNLIACGTAGNGTVVLCGNQERGTSNVGGIIICNQYNHTYNRIISGLWIDGGGTIRHYDGSGNEDWWINLASSTYNHS